MAQTEILSSISRSTTYPITATMSAPNNCGLLSVVLDNLWTEQMLHELPTINVKIYTKSNTLITSFDINMRTVNSDTRQVSAVKPYSIPIYELPSSYIISVTPLFDMSAITSHNELVENGIETSTIWTTETSTFNVSFSFDDVNIHAGGTHTGGGTAVLIEKSVTANGTYIAQDDGADGYSKVAVTVQSPSGGLSPNDVNFRDYDGKIVASYSAAEFASLTALPENPTHDGLISQGWNYSLADAKTYVAANGKLEIGQVYTTADGKTYIHIVLEDGRLDPVLGLGVNGSVDIDWGDGTEHTTLTGTSVDTYVSTLPHTYATAGAYTIKLTVTGSMAFMSINDVCGLLMKSGNDANQSGCYGNAIKIVNVGNGITSIGSNAFRNCYSLSNVTISKDVTSIGISAFWFCYSLSNVTIPESVTGIGSNAFSQCTALSSVTIPEGVTSIESSTFSECHSLSNVTIPEGVTSIGSSAFGECYSLSSVIIPEDVTSIGSGAFYNCHSLSNVAIPEGATSIGNSAFGECYSLSSAVIPEGVTGIGSYIFTECYSLSSVTIPEGVISIGSQAFSECYSLSNVTIPESVTSIGSYAFYNCYGLGKITFINKTPATAQSGAFSYVPTDCKIYVPQGSLSAYTSASNYPSSSTYTYIEY